MNLFRITDALERIERARRGPQGLLDEEWFDTHANGIPPLPSYVERTSTPSTLTGVPSDIRSPNSFGPISSYRVATATPSSDPIDGRYQARMKEALKEAFARLRGNVAMHSGDHGFPSTETLPGTVADSVSGDYDDRNDGSTAQTGDSSASDDTPAGRNKSSRAKVTSSGTTVFTSADFDRCVAQAGKLLATLSTPQGRIELCNTGQAASTLEGTRYRFDVRDGVLLARDSNGDVHSVIAGQGERATMTIDTDTGQIFADEPGLDI